MSAEEEAVLSDVECCDHCCDGECDVDEPMTNEELRDLLLVGLRNKLPLPKKTLVQKFWGLWAGLFGAISKWCENKQRTAAVKTAEQKVADLMLEIIKDNVDNGLLMFEGIGEKRDKESKAEEVEEDPEPLVLLPDDVEKNPSVIPSAVMERKPEDRPDPDKRYRDQVEQNVRKARLKYLLRQDSLSAEDRNELEELTKDESIIVLE